MRVIGLCFWFLVFLGVSVSCVTHADSDTVHLVFGIRSGIGKLQFSLPPAHFVLGDLVQMQQLLMFSLVKVTLIQKVKLRTTSFQASCCFCYSKVVESLKTPASC